VLPADTSPEAWQFWIEGLRQMTPSQKLRQSLDLSETVRRAAEAGLRQQYPAATDREIFVRLAQRILGMDLACKVYGDLLVEEIRNP
jgi:hypothetical protein